MNRKDKVGKIVDAFANLDYGESMTHGQIAELVGVKKTDSEYRYLIHQSQKQLIDHGKMVESIRGVGYRVINPDDYTATATQCVTTGVRKINRGAQILAHAPVADMTPDGLQAYNHVRDRMVILQAAVTGAKVEINMLAKKREHPLAATAGSVSNVP